MSLSAKALPGGMRAPADESPVNFLTRKLPFALFAMTTGEFELGPAVSSANETLDVSVNPPWPPPT